MQSQNMDVGSEYGENNFSRQKDYVVASHE
jgi:hypothetical protein